MRPDLTDDQLGALNRFAAQHGRSWKMKLNLAWCEGDYGALAVPGDASSLQQVRNTFGPTWLIRYKKGARK